MFDDDKNESGFLETMLAFYIGWHMFDDDNQIEKHDDECRSQTNNKKRYTGPSSVSFEQLFGDLFGIFGVIVLVLAIFGNKTAQYIFGGLCLISIICFFKVIICFLWDVLKNILGIVGKYGFSLLFSTVVESVFMLLLFSFRGLFFQISIYDICLLMICFLVSFLIGINYVYPKILEYLRKTISRLDKKAI